MKRTRPDLTPEQIALIRSWLALAEEGTPTPFRVRVAPLFKALGHPSSYIYAVLRRQRPDLWAALNRVREMWYERRDAALRALKAGAKRKDVARVLGTDADNLAHYRKREKRSKQPRWCAEQRRDGERALDAFEAAVERLEAECWPPVKPFPAMQELADALNLPVRVARTTLEYHRPDLFARYKALRRKYLAEQKQAIINGEATADVADWFDIGETTVRSQRKWLKDADIQRREQRERARGVRPGDRNDP